MFVYKLENIPHWGSFARAYGLVSSLCLREHKSLPLFLAKQPCVWHMVWQVVCAGFQPPSALHPSAVIDYKSECM